MGSKEGSGKQNSEKPWRHVQYPILLAVFGPLIGLYARIRYRIKADCFTEQGDRNYLILYNHQTPFDQFFVMMSFKGPVCYLASEDIFSNGWISSFIRWAVNPIPIKKQTTDRNAIRQIMKAVKEGETIAIAPEGNRTFSGKTENIKPSIAHLAKMMDLPIAIYRIEGGYGAQPRWSDCIRKGSMHSYVSRVIEPEEYRDLSREELYRMITGELCVNEACADRTFTSKRRAEYIERAAYVCPFCGLAEFYSSGNETECLTCHRKIIYNDDKSLSGVGFDLPFTFFNDWYEYQNDFINHLNTADYEDRPMFTDRGVCISQVIVYKKKVPFREDSAMSLYGNRIVIDEGGGREWVIPFEKMDGAALLGRNKINIYFGGKVWQFRGNRHFNALKYMNIYFRYSNQQKGDKGGEFLGL